jgi:hypothetical protein
LAERKACHFQEKAFHFQAYVQRGGAFFRGNLPLGASPYRRPLTASMQAKAYKRPRNHQGASPSMQALTTHQYRPHDASTARHQCQQTAHDSTILTGILQRIPAQNHKRRSNRTSSITDYPTQPNT